MDHNIPPAVTHWFGPTDLLDDRIQAYVDVLSDASCDGLVPKATDLGARLRAEALAAGCPADALSHVDAEDLPIEAFPAEASQALRRAARSNQRCEQARRALVSAQGDDARQALRDADGLLVARAALAAALHALGAGLLQLPADQVTVLAYLFEHLTRLEGSAVSERASGG